MNIWIFNHYAMPPKFPGITRHFDFAKELIKRGHEVTIFAASFHHFSHQETQKYKNKKYVIKKIDGIKFIFIKTIAYKKNDGWRRLLGMLIYAFRARRIAEDIKPNPDIVIGVSVHLFAGYIAYKVAKQFQAPFVMEVGDLWPQTLIDMGMSHLHPIIFIFSVLEKFLYRRALKIITLMPKAHQYIEKYGINFKKIVWISNGVDLERFNSQYIRGRGNKKFIVRYTGTIGRANNLIVLVEAARLLKSYSNILIEIIGDGDQKRQLIKLSRKYKLNNIHFVKAVPKQKIPKLLITADILFVTCQALNVLKYGMSFNKLFDYLASKRPIIYASKTYKNLVKESGAGITIPPNNPKELARTIIKFSKMDKKSMSKMGEKGYSFVKKHYDIPILVDKLENILNRVRQNALH